MIVYAFTVLTVLGIVSTILNSFLLVVFVKGFANLKKLPYIIFCWQILICNLTGLFVKFAYVIPNSAWDHDKSRWTEPYVAVMALIETLVYHGELIFILALALHRLFIFFCLSIASDIKFCIAKVIFCWILVFLFVGGSVLFDCFDTSISPNLIENGVFDEVKFYSVCDTSTLPKQMFVILIAIINDYLPVFTLVLYAMIVIKIRYNQYRNSPNLSVPTGRRKQQQDLIIFLQAFVTYGCFFFKFRVLNMIGYTDASHGVLLKCLIYVSIYVRDTTQAVFMLSFNQNVKNIAKSIIYQREFSSSSNVVVPTSRIVSKIDREVSKN